MHKHSLSLFLTLLFSCAAHAASPALESANRLAQAGSPQLALKQVESNQPAKTDAPDWLAWEKLRLSLLQSLGRAEQLLPRVAQLPADLPKEFLRDAYLAAAQSAIKLKQGTQARNYLARLLWQLEPGADAALLRRLVLESYLVEGRAADAYLVQLRALQDQPQDKAMLARVMQTMLEAGMAREAATWLPQLDDGAFKLLLRLEAGLLTPEAAQAEASRAMQKKPEAIYWLVMLRAGQAQNDAAGMQAAREQLLNSPGMPESGMLHVPAQSVWQAYRELGLETANQASLLMGDDASWLEQAGKEQPVKARALLAYLAANARDPEQAAEAQARLVQSLRDGHLALAALRLYEKEEVSRLAVPTRHALGELAADLSRLAEAAKYWRGQDTPPAGLDARQWQLKRAAVFVRAAQFGDAAEALGKLLAEQDALPNEQAHAALQLLLDMQDASAGKQADALLQQLLLRAPTFLHKDIQFSLGEIAQANGRYEAAANAFLQSAMLAGERDALALTARFKAAAALAKAGLKEDARLQYQWLLKASKDPAQQGAIRRALSQL